MRKSEVSSTLTVYHDGQFWVGVVEHVENDMLKVERVMFGAEPSNEEVYTWVLERWSSLRLSAEAEPVGPRVGRLPGNPKRRAREAAKAMHQRGPSTNEEVYTWVLERWSSLRLSAEAEPVGPRVGRLPGNPKRRAREAAKAMHQRGPSTEAAKAMHQRGPSTVSQLALARERERVKDESRSERAVRRQDEARSRWEGRCERKRRKHRGK